jgi:ketosteroid isomerase-like protein
MDRQEQLLARLEIEALNAEFAYLIDRGRCEDVADLFTEDGSYGRSTGERSVGRAAIRAAYAQRKARGERTSRHIFTNLRLTFEKDRATGQSILTLFAADGPPPHAAEPFLVADYDDVYVRDGEGRWRYRSRTVTWLFLQKDGATSPLPLGAPSGAPPARERD